MRFDNYFSPDWVNELKAALGLNDVECTEAWEEYQMTISFYMLELEDTRSNPL